MEYRMQLVASRTEDDCLGYGQYLYGRKKEGPHIGHLDGRNTPKDAAPVLSASWSKSALSFYW